jgi:hypothetical protein
VTAPTTWPGYDQPTLVSADVPADTWEAGRVATGPVQLSEEITTAADLLGADGCSPQCLLSANRRVQDCNCACKGQFHAVLADADMASAVRRRDARLQVVTTKRTRP